jgi:cytochrome c peroxidase
MRGFVAALSGLAFAITTSACGSEPLVDGTFTPLEWQTIQTLSPLPAAPADPTNAVADDPRAVALGQALFYDPRAAGPLAIGDDGANGANGAVGETGKVACASCHLPASTWLDDTRSKPGHVSIGADYGVRNAPPIVDAVFYRWYGWAGQDDTMWHQAMGTTESAKSHNSSRLAVAHLLHDHYKAPYEALFGPIDPRFDPLDANAAAFPATGKPGVAAYDAMPDADKTIVTRMFVNYGKVLAAYDRVMVSRNSAFDRYVAGETTAISDAAKRGLKIFVSTGGCVACHKTPLFSDSDFHDLGVPQQGDHIPAEDLGRYTAIMKLMTDPLNSAGVYSDDPSASLVPALVLDDSSKGKFRTKHLREISGTAPYMHTGGFATLRDVVDFYDAGGGGSGFAGTKDPRIVPLGLSDGDKDDLVAFLGTLAGDPMDPAWLQDTHAP